MSKHTRNFLKYVFTPGDLVELRCMARNGTESVVVAGRFEDLDRMAVVAEDVDSWPQTTAVYYTVNPIDPKFALQVGDYSINSMKARARTTRDSYITRRNDYFVDFDPTRPSGVCSTDDERRAAYAVMLTVRDYLRSLDWPEPIEVDSGNGYHLHFRGDGCDPNSRAWNLVLQYLNKTFGTEAVKVDTCVGNPARICRLPGTLNRKGPNTPERPHRRSMVVRYPQQWVALAHGTIYRLAEDMGLMSASRSSSSMSDLPSLVEDVEDALDEFIYEYKEYLEVVGRFERHGVMYYALRECPFAGRAHKGGAVGHTCIALSDTAVGFSCFSDDCDGYSFSDLRRHLAEISGYESDVAFYEYEEPMTDEEFAEGVAKMCGCTVAEMMIVDIPAAKPKRVSIDEARRLLCD